MENQIQTTMEIPEISNSKKLEIIDSEKSVPEIPESFKRQKKVYVSRQECTRYNPETGAYNDKPVDPEYFKKYYQNHKEKVKCEICNKTTGKFKMFRHLKSQKCQMAARLHNYAKPLDEPKQNISLNILEILD